MSNNTDRRIARTHRLLWDALFSLLQDQDWADITVQSICERADIGRSTFYSHFQTKQALLEAGFALQLAQIKAEVLADAARGSEDSLATVRWLCAHLDENRSMTKRVSGTAAGLLIVERFRKALAQVLADELALRGLHPPGWRMAFVTGGLFAAREAALADGVATKTLETLLSRDILALCEPNQSRQTP